MSVEKMEEVIDAAEAANIRPVNDSIQGPKESKPSPSNVRGFFPFRPHHL